MSNPSRKKGTAYESVIRDKYKSVFGSGVTRSAAGTPSNDLSGLPFAVEVKAGYTGLRQEWFRKARDVHGTWWVLHWNGGDLRRTSSVGELTVLPTSFFLELLEHAWEYGAF